MKFGLLFASTIVAAAVAGAASAGVVICDPSFEAPTVPAAGYQYGTQSGAQVSSNGQDLTPPSCLTVGPGAGIQANGSAWGFATAPDGNQTAFLQSYNNQTPGQITQTVTGLTIGDRYRLDFDDSDRPGYAVDPVTISISGIGGLGTFTPLGDTWGAQSTPWFIATATGATITYSVATNAGDADIGIHNASLAVPEPLTWILMIGGVAMIGTGLRFNRRKVGEALAAT